MSFELEPPEEIDPVCGQEVDPEQAHDLGLEVSYAGRRHVFCGQAHRAAFLADPLRYARPEEPKIV